MEHLKTFEKFNSDSLTDWREQDIVCLDCKHKWHGRPFTKLGAFSKKLVKNSKCPKCGSRNIDEPPKPKLGKNWEIQKNEGNMMDLWFNDKKPRESVILNIEEPKEIEISFKDDIGKFEYLFNKYGIKYTIRKPEMALN